MQYSGYQLDEDGDIKEKLDAESEDFLCYEQNQYNIAEGEVIGASHNRNTFIDPYEVVSQTKSEIISLPYCASMLNDKVVLRQRNNESSCRYFLRDLEKGEDTFLFDAESILFIIPDGIFYFADIGDDFMYYSFADQTSLEIPLPEFWEADITYMDYCLTYNEKSLYFYYGGSSSKQPEILQLSLEDWSVETVAAGAALSETDASKVSQADEEYVYHGEQMYLIP